MGGHKSKEQKEIEKKCKKENPMCPFMGCALGERGRIKDARKDCEKEERERREKAKERTKKKEEKRRKEQMDKMKEKAASEGFIDLPPKTKSLCTLLCIILMAIIICLLIRLIRGKL